MEDVGEADPSKDVDMLIGDDGSSTRQDHDELFYTLDIWFTFAAG